MKNKGFTLVELLAVIVVLTFLILLVVPIVQNTIESSKIKSFKNSVNGLVAVVNDKVASDTLKGKKIDYIYTFENGRETTSILSDYIKGKKPDNAKIVVNSEGEIIFTVWNKKLKMCAYKKTDNSKIKYVKNIKTGKLCRSILFSS